MRTLVRRDLKDEDSNNYRWTNDEVDRMVDRAIREYSIAAPYEQKATKATTSNSRIISVSTLTNVILYFAVEFPISLYPPEYQRFSLIGTDIRLEGERLGDGTNSYIYYGAMHDIDATTWTIPVAHEHIIATGAVAYAMLQYGAYSGNRVNVGGLQTPMDFIKWGERYLDEFKKELKKLKSRVRQQTLYAPATPLQSKTTDWGP